MFNHCLITRQIANLSSCPCRETKTKPDKTWKGLGVDLQKQCENSKFSTVFMGWHEKHFTSH